MDWIPSCCFLLSRLKFCSYVAWPGLKGTCGVKVDDDAEVGNEDAKPSGIRADCLA